MKIVGDILTTTKDETMDEDGATITFLMRKANVSHVRLTRILHTLVSQGLLEQKNSEGACKYKISNSGRDFLIAYQKFRNFAQNVGF